MSFLKIEGLVVEFGGGPQAIRALDGLDLDVERGETVAIVGKSGSGKSVASLSILGLLARSAHIVSGSIWLDGENLLDKSDREMRAIRGNRVAMVFQEPMSSLNPAHTIGKQIAEPLWIHRGLRGAQARAQALALLRLAQIADPERRLDEYPHELSGGMRQRVMIAIALACKPALLIADEPTTALDVTTQAQILDLMRDLKAQLSMAVLLVTHDFGVVAELADRVVVLYAGRVVERGPALEIFDHPRHPYTRALMAARPELEALFAEAAIARLADIPGVVQPLRKDAVGCGFAERCTFTTPRCRIETPALREIGAGHRAACHLVAEVSR